MKNLTILNRLWRGARSNAALEFGLILPILSAIVLARAIARSYARSGCALILAARTPRSLAADIAGP